MAHLRYVPESTAVVQGFGTSPSLLNPAITAVAGLVAVDNCLAGYNSSIFAYGQTGSGKTFTVIGDLQDAETVCSCSHAGHLGARECERGMRDIAT